LQGIATANAISKKQGIATAIPYQMIGH